MGGPFRDELVTYAPDPDAPGWWIWRTNGQTYNDSLAPLTVRREGDAVRLRMQPTAAHGNLMDGVHGGAMLGLIDVAFFATCRVLERFEIGRASTIECGCQFVGASRIGVPLDAVTELLRETGRLAFLRGTIEQDGALVAAYHGTVRKPFKETELRS